MGRLSLAERASNLNLFLQMTKILTPNNKLDWINLIASVHNLVCSCNRPLAHTIEEILIQEPQLKIHIPERCLTGTTTEPGTAVDDHIDDGDLENLFAKDFDEHEEGAGTSG